MNTKRGRPRKEMNSAVFEKEKAAYQAREITAKKAAENLGVGRTTFFSRLKEQGRRERHE